MSLIDDQAAEMDAQLDVAWKKCVYGRRYSPAYELADQIKSLCLFTSLQKGRPTDRAVNRWARQWRAKIAEILLGAAITSSRKLREVADALDAEKKEDPRQLNILKAYQDCISGRYPPTIIAAGKCFVRCSVPTLAQLRDAFIKRFGEKCVPADFSLRKTVKVLGLPLNDARLGRPRSTKRRIRNRKH